MVDKIHIVIGIALLIPIQILAQNLFSDQIIISTTAQGARSIHVSDLNGDGDLDILAACDAGNKIIWHENVDGKGSFGEERIIDAGAERAWSVHAADFDDDGDMDVLSVALLKNQITWYENTDGLGNFGPPELISTAVDHPTCVYAADLDGDSDFDVLSASSGDDKIAWYENTDGNGHFGGQQVITSTAEQASFVTAADVDGDGDMDIISAAYHYDNIVWHENSDGKGSFSSKHVVSKIAEQVESVCVADLDGDYDLDILSASWGDEKIAWYKNTDGKGAYGSQQILASSAKMHNSVFAADLDGDSDMDVLTASTDRLIAWHENSDGKGNFGSSQTISSAVVDARDVCAADLDNDGDQDVISASWFDNKIAWYKNLSRETSVEENKSEAPKDFRLYQNYPNPFNPSTTIRYTLPNAGTVTLKIHDLTGREIETLVNGIQSAGEHHVLWKAEGLTSGLYFCRLQSGDPSTSLGQGFTETMKFILQK